MAFTEDIVTKRLQIHPLDDKEFSAFMNGLDHLERKMGITVSDEKPNPEFQIRIEWMALHMVVHQDEFPWWTLWHIRLRNEDRTVGYLCFRGAPDETGGVEIAYTFIYPRFLDQGIMTEAVESVSGWALAQENVKYVMAEVEGWNVPAQRVFEKNGFFCYNDAEEVKYYCKQLPDIS